MCRTPRKTSLRRQARCDDPRIAPMNATLFPFPQPGDRAPACYGMAMDRRFYSFEEQYGRPVVLILVGATAAPDLRPLIDDFAACEAMFTERNADVLLLVNDNPALLWPETSPPLRIIDCGTFLLRCGVAERDT